MFQPGEEGYRRRPADDRRGRARRGRPAARWPRTPCTSPRPSCRWVFATRAGPMMAAADMLEVTVRGHGGHGSQPHLAADPIPAACEMVTALQTLVTRRFDVFDPVVITVGSFHAGTADNVIPDEARFLATVRSFSAAARDQVRDGRQRLVREHRRRARAAGGRRVRDGYPVTVNDAAEVDALPRHGRGRAVRRRAGWSRSRTRCPGRRTSRSCSRRCRGRSSCWARARPAPTRPRRRSTTRPTPCSTTRCCRRRRAAGRAGPAPPDRRAG